MSRDAVEAEITLEEGALVSGGRATLQFRTTAREPVRVRGAHVAFVGYEETKAVYTTSDGKTTTTHTATERNVLVEERTTFQGRAPDGFFRNLADGALTLIGGGDHEELPRGTHEVGLDVALPVELPATFEAKKVKVCYEALVHLDIPAGRDFRRTVTFDVPHVRANGDPAPEPLTIRYPEDTARGFFDSVFGPDVAMTLEMERTVVRRGGRLAGELEVRFPDKPPKIAAIVCSLIRRESSEAQGHRDRHAEVIVTERFPQRPGVSRGLFASFEVHLPDAMIPSCRGAKFTLAHELAVSLEVPWAKDPTIRIPIVVV